MQAWLFRDSFWNYDKVQAFLSRIPIVKKSLLKILFNFFGSFLLHQGAIDSSRFNFRSSGFLSTLFFFFWTFVCMEYGNFYSYKLYFLCTLY